MLYFFSMYLEIIWYVQNFYMCYNISIFENLWKLKNLIQFFSSWQPVIDFIDSKYDEYLNAESRVVRSPTPDTRVHACLYFIAPTGHGFVFLVVIDSAF